jgi:hypothetical protein
MKKRKNLKYLTVLLAGLTIFITVSAGIAGDSGSKGMNDNQSKPETDMSPFDHNKYVYVDADAVAKSCGAVIEEGEAFGQKFTQTKWDGEVLRKVLKKIEPELHGGKAVAIMGHTPNWVLAALACAAEPNQSYMFSTDPNFPGGVPYSPIAKPELGKFKPEGHVTIVFERDLDPKRKFGNFVVVSDKGDFEDFPCADTLKIGLPNPPIRDADIFLFGWSPVHVAATVARAYKDHCNSLWMKYHEEPVYTCVWSNSPNIKVGDQMAAAPR